MTSHPEWSTVLLFVAGPTGAAGTSGTNGATGSTGPTGAAGTSGVSGTSGVTGPTGPTGPTGAAGTSGVSGTSDGMGKLQDLLDFMKSILPSPIGGDLNAVYVFSASASVWGLTHSLSKLPSVTTVNNDGEEIEGLVQYHISSYITISYNQPVAGKVYLN
jgi:hypothetical protein